MFGAMTGEFLYSLISASVGEVADRLRPALRLAAVLAAYAAYASAHAKAMANGIAHHRVSTKVTINGAGSVPT